MTEFHIEINDRLAQLSHANELIKKKAQFKKVYSMALVDTDGNEIINVDDFQAAFLDLLNDRYPQLLNLIQQPLDQRFYEMYQNSNDEDEKNYKPNDELSMHKIQIPSPISNEWQLMYEMKSDETIFHVEFEGWNFKLIGVTH